MICTKCSFLLRRYARRVSSFLSDPPPEYMQAMGYDVDVVRFSRDCERWRIAVRHACKATEDED